MSVLNDFSQFLARGSMFFPEPSIEWRGLPKNISYTEGSLTVLFDIANISKVTSLTVTVFDHHTRQSDVLYDGAHHNRDFTFDFELPSYKTVIDFKVVLDTESERLEFSETVNINHPEAKVFIQDFSEQAYLNDDFPLKFSTKYLTKISLTVDNAVLFDEVIGQSQHFLEKVTEVLLNTQELGEKRILINYEDLEGKLTSIELHFIVNPRRLQVEVIKLETNVVELLIKNSLKNRLVLKSRGVDVKVPNFARIEHAFIWEQQAELICLDDAGDEYSFPLHMKFKPIKLNIF